MHEHADETLHRLIAEHLFSMERLPADGRTLSSGGHIRTAPNNKR